MHHCGETRSGGGYTVPDPFMAFKYAWRWKYADNLRELVRACTRRRMIVTNKDDTKMVWKHWKHFFWLHIMKRQGSQNEDIKSVRLFLAFVFFNVNVALLQHKFLIKRKEAACGVRGRQYKEKSLCTLLVSVSELVSSCRLFDCCTLIIPCKCNWISWS